MLYTKKDKLIIKKFVLDGQDAVVDWTCGELNIVEHRIEEKMLELKNEMMDLIFSLAGASKIKPKTLAANISLVKVQTFAKELLAEINKRIDEEAKKATKLAKKIVPNAIKARKIATKKKVK